jgi:hypothetical protein
MSPSSNLPVDHLTQPLGFLLGGKDGGLDRAASSLNPTPTCKRSIFRCTNLKRRHAASFVPGIPGSRWQREDRNQTLASMNTEKTTTVLAQQLLGLDICQITLLQALSLLHALQQQVRRQFL